MTRLIRASQLNKFIRVYRAWPKCWKRSLWESGLDSWTATSWKQFRPRTKSAFTWSSRADWQFYLPSLTTWCPSVTASLWFSKRLISTGRMLRPSLISRPQSNKIKSTKKFHSQKRPKVLLSRSKLNLNLKLSLLNSQQNQIIWALVKTQSLSTSSR